MTSKGGGKLTKIDHFLTLFVTYLTKNYQNMHVFDRILHPFFSFLELLTTPRIGKSPRNAPPEVPLLGNTDIPSRRFHRRRLIPAGWISLPFSSALPCL